MLKSEGGAELFPPLTGLHYDSWPCPSLETAAGELAPSPRGELAPALRRDGPTPHHRRGKADPKGWLCSLSEGNRPNAPEEHHSLFAMYKCTIFGEMAAYIICPYLICFLILVVLRIKF